MVCQDSCADDHDDASGGDNVERREGHDDPDRCDKDDSKE